MNKDLEKVARAKLVEFAEFLIRLAVEENLEDLEVVVYNALQTARAIAKSAAIPEEFLSVHEQAIVEAYENLKAERDAIKLQ
ncbi:hypothetical protein ABNF65_08080 [Paenibacillus larvae]